MKPLINRRASKRVRINIRNLGHTQRISPAKKAEGPKEKKEETPNVK